LKIDDWPLSRNNDGLQGRETREGKIEQASRYTAISYLTDAKEYLQAATILHKSQIERITGPQYFLMSQSIELFLKAFIIGSGGTLAELKKFEIRHSLKALFERASELGYRSKSEKTKAVIELLHPHHADHSFRYRKTGFKTYPAIREGLDTLARMDSEISPVVSASVRRDNT
jgi:HEPN domain-containing protein